MIKIFIKQVEIENFRNFKKFKVEFTEFNFIIGENNIGKTNLFKAIDMVLNPWSNLRFLEIKEEDFRDVNYPLKIKITINDVDEEIKKDLKFDMYDPEEGSLSIEFSASWDEESNEFKPKMVFLKNLEDEQAEDIFFKKEQRKVIPFFPIYIKKSVEKNLNLTKKSDFGNLVNLCIPELTTPQKILLSRCKNLLEEISDLTEDYEELNPITDKCNHLLDIAQDLDFSNLTDEIDKIFTKYYEISQGLEIPSEVDKTVIQVLEKFKRSVFFVNAKSKNQKTLENLSENIKSLQEFKDFSSSFIDIIQELLKFTDFQMNFQSIEEKKLLSSPSILIDSFSILLHGSGYQNQFLIALKLLNIISYLKKKGLKSAFVGIEEPELNLHPHHQRDLISRINTFIKKIKEEEDINLQILITSHSAEILRKIDYTNLILLKKSEGTIAYRIPSDFIEQMTESLAPVHKSLTRIKNNLIKSVQNLFSFYPETFFSRVVILGEGSTEEGALPEFGKTLHSDFDDLGITFVSTQTESNMDYYRIIMETLSIPYYYILDKDRGNKVSSNANLRITKEKAFEDEIFATISFSKVLEVLNQLIPEQTSIKWISAIESLLPTGISDFEELINFCEHNTVDDKIKDFFKKELHNFKGPRFGHLIGNIASFDEIPQSYREIINSASEKSKEVY